MFIVIDGTDGAGKTTQLKLLSDRLRSAGFEVEIADFPQYGRKSAGLVEEYLQGKYGNVNEVSPYIASIFFACDRYDASFKIRRCLQEGKIVISNRYVTANMGHQGGEIADSDERQAYYNWLLDLEYGIFGIPKPDLNIILRVEASVAQKLARQENKGSRDPEHGLDILEDDLDHLVRAEQAYLDLARTLPNSILIECSPAGQILPKEIISDLIWEKTKNAFQDINKINHRPKSPFGTSGSLREKLKIIKLSPFAKTPTRHEGYLNSFNLYSGDYESLAPGKCARIKTGLKLKIPSGRTGNISGLAEQKNTGLSVIPDIIEPNYTRELYITIANTGEDVLHIAPGQKIAILNIK